MYPELLRIGSFPINTYGVFLAIAFLAAILITVKLAERDGLPRQKIYDLSLWMLLAGLVGSKILMLFVEPEYRDNPLAASISGLPAFRWCLLRRASRRCARGLFVDEALSTALVENR